MQVQFKYSRWWITLLEFLNIQSFRNIPPPQITSSEQINLSEYVSYKSIFNDMVDNLQMIEQEEVACHCFVEGYEEALGILEFLINAELSQRFDDDVIRFHEELEDFLKNHNQ